MPTVTEKTVPAFAHCADGRCPGYKQVPVEGVRTTTEVTYVERNGSGAVPGVEFSTETVRFADEDADGTCEHCQGPKSIAEEVRPEYAHVSGQPQDALLKVGQMDVTVRELAHSSELDKLQRDHEMEDMRRQLEEMRAELASKASKPGPKPKQED